MSEVTLSGGDRCNRANQNRSLRPDHVCTGREQTDGPLRV